MIVTVIKLSFPEKGDLGMEYISTLEASEKWDISIRQVQRLLVKNRIPYAKKHGRAWMIPKGAEKPIDLRKEKQLPNKSLLGELSYVFLSTTLPMPRNNPDLILEFVDEEKVRFQYEGQLAYLRGEFKQTIDCFLKIGTDDAAKIRACPVAMAATISMGDYKRYTQIDSYLKDLIKANRGPEVSALAELILATVTISLATREMAPNWLEKGDLTNLPIQAKPHALYLRAKYFQHLGKYEAMLGVAQTALVFCSMERGLMMCDIYLRLICALANYFLGRIVEAKAFLLDAMNIALPHGFITPFVESIVDFGGLVELCLEQEFPEHYDVVIKQWKHTWKNWIFFHNELTEDNITIILSLREYHIAMLVARRVPHRRIAEHHNISIGRLKNIISVIYSKLLVSNRDELSKHILWAQKSDFYR